jgi:tetratricopeptide (TPR) repeat protein
MESQMAQRDADALATTESLLASEPELSQEIWLSYLRAHLLDSLGRTHDANEALTGLLSADGELADYGRLRLAQLQEQMGHPEVAAGLVATLLGRGAPAQLVDEATELLARTLSGGADCRLLGRMEAWDVPDAERRTLRLAQADCVLASGDSSDAAQRLLDLLTESTDDLVAREAAQRLRALPEAIADSGKAPLMIGMAFHGNREFEESTEFLERGLATLDPESLTLDVEELFGYRYASARGHFWLRRYHDAATRFQELAEVAHRDSLKADCLYQAARSRELAGDWRAASTVFRQAFVADRTGEWSGPALLSAMRIDFRGGYEEQALELFDVLRSRLAWQGLAQRAALFLSASDIVRGRSDRAANWLRLPATPTIVEELLYSRAVAAMTCIPHGSCSVTRIPPVRLWVNDCGLSWPRTGALGPTCDWPWYRPTHGRSGTPSSTGQVNGFWRWA